MFAMPNNPRRSKHVYEWDPERKLFVKKVNASEVDADPKDSGGLLSCSIEELALLPYWLVPLSRRDELYQFKGHREREARTKLQEVWMLRSQQYKTITESGRLDDGMRDVQHGPRGGRYTLEISRDGRPYRRYF